MGSSGRESKKATCSILSSLYVWCPVSLDREVAAKRLSLSMTSTKELPLMTLVPWPVMIPLLASPTTSLVCQERTIPSIVRFLKLPLPVMDKLMEVTTLTLRPSVRCSTSAQLMEPVVSPSTASSVPTEPSSTRTTLSATGGSTSTAPPLRSSTPSMTTLLLKGRPLIPQPELPVIPSTATMPLLLNTLEPSRTSPATMPSDVVEGDCKANSDTLPHVDSS